MLLIKSEDVSFFSDSSICYNICSSEFNINYINYFFPVLEWNISLPWTHYLKICGKHIFH